jgi:phage-related protein
MANNTVKIRIDGDASKFNRAMDAVGVAAKRVGGTVRSAFKNVVSAQPVQKGLSAISKGFHTVRDHVEKFKSSAKSAYDEYGGAVEKVTMSTGALMKSMIASQLVVKGLSAIAQGIRMVGEQTANLTRSAISAYADYEQLVGGVDTLFKDASKAVQQYATNAYKTAGLSANAYMDTVTSFSASLIQSLKGDTELAAEKANMAIVDMADNSNKLGTDMFMVQNAYQGFAKQNYTMLDNLKLGGLCFSRV